MGKKKKSVANKLAKMSDDERARYMQRRADIEEEAKKRKEELISSFMKNKIKKEEAFSRLNLAKINQNWHQILRKAKCKEMKENVGHMKKWIHRVLDLKNKTIEKLLEELDEAEFQYTHNLQAHLTHIDKLIGCYDFYKEKLEDDYDEDMTETLEIAIDEEEEHRARTEEQEHCLKTIIYKQDVWAKEDYDEVEEYYMKKYYDIVATNTTNLEKLHRTHNEISNALWKQIAEVIRDYVQRTDLRRAHLAELRRLDAESAAEIANTQERINAEEITIDILKEDYEKMVQNSEASIKFLEKEVKDIQMILMEKRKQLQSEITKDTKQLREVTSLSNTAVMKLEEIVKKGEHILSLMTTCQKFETTHEQIVKWLPVCDSKYLEESLTSDIPDVDVFIEKDDTGASITPVNDIEEIPTEESLPELEQIKDKEDELQAEGTVCTTETIPPKIGIFKKKTSSRPRTTLVRPKTSFVRKSSAYKKRIKTGSTQDSRRPSILKKVVISEKVSPTSSSSSKSSDATEEKRAILRNYFEELEKMEIFWFTYNKVAINFEEMKEEKKALAEENKKLRGMMRAVLEAAALAHSIPSSKVSTRIGSRSRIAYSAPARRLLF